MNDLKLALRYCHYIDLMGTVKDLINSNTCLKELMELTDIHKQLDNLREMFQKPLEDLKVMLNE